MMESLSALPAFLTPVKLSGPYDADIPTREANQIKNASFMLDWAVPYVFIEVATHFESEGDEERSIHFFNRAIVEFHKRNNMPGEGSAFSRKISALIRFGQFQIACLAIKGMEKKWSDAPYNAFIFYSYGYYHLKNGDYAKARKYFKQALDANVNYADDPDFLALRRDTEFQYGITLVQADYFQDVSHRLCFTDLDENFYQNVRRHVSEGLSRLERVPALNKQIFNTRIRHYFPEIIPSSMESNLYNLIGLAYGIAGKMPEAVKNIETAMGLAQKKGYHLGEVDSILFLNQIYLLGKNRVEGIKGARVLAEIAERYQLVSYSVWANMVLGHHYKETGDVDQTMKAMDKALTLMEENGSWLSRDADVRGIGIFQRQVIYEALLDLYVAKSDDRMAFKTAERAKAAMLADRLSKEVIAKTPDVIERLKQLHANRMQLTKYYKTLLSPVSTDAVFMDTVKKTDGARRNDMKLMAGIKEQDEALYSLIGAFPLDADDLQRLLDNNTTLFTYFVSTQYLYVWVISKNGFHQEKISIARKDVDRLVNAYLSALMSRNKSQTDALAEKVYNTLLKPVIPFVYGDRVGFVPHGTLYNLPFASMRYVNSYLVDGFTIFHLPYAGLMKNLPAKKTMPVAPRVIIFADAQCVKKRRLVTSAKKEIDILKKTFPQADYFVKNDSSREDLQKLTGNYDMIHFILNCYPTEEVSRDACLPLAATGPRQGCLSIRDIFHLQLSGRTAVLSACQTIKGLSSKGPGMTALVGAWLYAASSQVMTQLWEVDDKTKTVLMGLFYKNLEKSGGAADALRAAQNEMIQMGYGPSDWAAFILNGHA